MDGCDLGDVVAAIGAGWSEEYVGNAPGELSLAALVSAARIDPRRAIREYRAEAMTAAGSAQLLDVFSRRRLRARALRYARAAAIVEEQCLACVVRCTPDAVSVARVVVERRLAPGRRAGWRSGGRRLDDRVEQRLPAFA